MSTRKISRSLLVLLAASLTLALHALWDHIERRHLVAGIDGVLSRGEAVQDTVVPPSPAGAYVSAAAMLVTAIPTEQVEATVDRGSSTPLDVRWLPPGSPAIRTLLETGTHALMLADQAATLGVAKAPGLTDVSFHAAGLAGLSRLIAMRTRDYAAEGRGDEAAASAVVGLTVRGATGDLPIPMVQAEVGEVLSRSQPGDAALLAWDAALRNADAPDAVAREIERARGRFIERVWRQNYGPSPTAPRTQTLPRPGLLPWLWRPWFSRQIAGDLREWGEVLEVARQTPAERAAVVTAHEEKRRASEPQSVFQRGRWFMGVWPNTAWTSLAHAVRRDTLAHDRVTRTVLAIERFRRAEGGRLPESLDDLVPRILEALPHDPFTAAPPLYRRTADGYVVYSVGPNLKDDGGDLSLPPLEWDAQGTPYRSGPPDVGIVVTR